MSKARALKIGMAATVVVTTAACAALMAMHAGGELVAVAMVVLGGSGAHVLSRIVMHYD
jgi:hypothetical protein